MPFTFEKVTVKKWTVEKVYANYMQFKYFAAVRTDIKKCQICESKFKDADTIHLAFVKGRVNHIICSTCKNTAEENGVEMQYKKSEERPLPKFD